MKKHKEVNFPFGSHGVLYVYAFAPHTPSLILILFWDCKSIHFRLKKVFYFSTKRLCFAECLFSFMQRWINRRKIRFTVYSILIKAKARSNMNTALIRALTNVKLCVSNMSWLYLYLGSLTKKGTNVILALTALLTYTKRGIKYLNGFDMHLIPRSNMTITLTLLLTCLKAFKHTTALDTDLLGKSCLKTSWV